jgi:L-fucose mutarotase/ribose pyranase (RbsD/FucU family)
LVLPKPEFYARSKNAFAVVATGEGRRFSNLILRKGIIECS